MNTHVLSNPFLGQEGFGGVLECTADKVDLTLRSASLQKIKRSQHLVNVFLFGKKRKKENVQEEF